jgi:hypothetical protein
MILLQSAAGSGTGIGLSFLIYILVIILIIVIQIAIIRWIFKINRQVENQRAQIWLLMKLCEKNGVTEAELTGFKQSFHIE